MHTPQEIIIKKRQGDVLSIEDIQLFVKGVTDGSFKKYQSSALLMATFLNGMTNEETAALTLAMMRSGEMLEFSEIDRIPVDKHSTGGVGDKVSLILGPLAAACGLAVPMVSGRGLGHTGGTLDKLESIPGFKTALTAKAIQRQVKKMDLAIVGQTEKMVPADRELYALRDVTGTVESIPLITASIMSKKLAEGIDGLVLDVKVGRGAFMKTLPEARELAQSLVKTGKSMGKRTRALITAMDEPLGHTVGNALEVEESIACLRGRGPADLMDLTHELVAEMLLVGQRYKKRVDAIRCSRRAIDNGKALEYFRKMVKAQGGDPKVVDDPSILPQSKRTVQIRYGGESGFLHQVDSMVLARVANQLGAGRKSTSDVIDPSVGLSGIRKEGEAIESGDLLCVLHVNKKAKLGTLEDLARSAFTVKPGPVPKKKRVLQRIR